jgi:glycosyltransferase involved in cell wall biosynthesis
MATVKLSYILTTFNKLDYLSITLPLLIQSKKEDEEIVIVDGGSTDGTVDYLKKLYSEKKIDQFISEKDFGEAHGTNKAMLLSKGELIKIITDDDIFYYPAINDCKDFMLKHKQIDILGFDGFGFNTNHSTYSFKTIDYVKGFEKWQANKTPFLFCGLSFMMRKTSLAYMGLFNVNYKIVDIEYAIRVSSMKTKIAFYTGMGYVNIVNPQSNSHKFYETIAKEREMLSKLYPTFKNKISYRGSVIKLKEIISKSILKKSTSTNAQFDYKNIVNESIKKLNDHNSDKKFNFLH